MGGAVIASAASVVSAVITVGLAYLLTQHMAREQAAEAERAERDKAIARELGELRQVGQQLVAAQPPRVQRRMRLPAGW